jgi:hypothetical protein
MNKANGVLVFFLLASLGLACNDGALKSRNAGTGGQSSATASGGSLGGGGFGAGGPNAGGSATSGASGAGGSTCLPTLCVDTGCPGGYLPNPEPCGCPICADSDAGAGKDSETDAACLSGPCALPLCAAGYQAVAPPCGCPTCVPVDAGPQATCKDLDECACQRTEGCAPLVESCYCPYPQCGSNGACVCGGGKYLGCAPAGLATCSGAKAQLAGLCPTLKGPTFDGLCAGTNSACITKCLGEVNSCSDVSCTFCEACDCVGDRFSLCLGTCTSAMAQQ